MRRRRNASLGAQPAGNKLSFGCVLGTQLDCNCQLVRTSAPTLLSASTHPNNAGGAAGLE
eukprot:scaffold41896_cov69-Phaeocystis_antarctica.AAC.2